MYNLETAVETKSKQSDATGVLTIPPNSHRCGLLLSPPVAALTGSGNVSKNAQGVSVAAGGVKLSFTVPAGVQCVLTSATMVETTGAGAVAALQWTPAGGVATDLATVTTAGSFNGNFPLSPGDTIAWNVTTTVVGGVADFALGLTQDRQEGVLISIGAGRTPGQGIVLPVGARPLLLTAKALGRALQAAIVLEDVQGQQRTFTWTEYLYAP